MSDPDLLTSIGAATLRAGTPLLLAALGELVAEKSGILNLGLEGMMLMGAVTGFGVTLATGNPGLGLLAAMLAAMLLALIHAFLTIDLSANQVASGLALSIFGGGLSAFLGAHLVGKPIHGLQPLNIPLLADLPVLGPILFRQDGLVYLALLLTFAVAWFLRRSRAGLMLRSVGENPDSAMALGLPVRRIRYLAVLFGGALAGLAGAYLSMAYTPMWVEDMTAGRGWIALALVVFASWRPGRLLLGAWLFGLVGILQLFMQGAGLPVSPYLMSTLPYLATILVLVLISRDALRVRLSAPAALGRPFRPAL